MMSTESTVQSESQALPVEYTKDYHVLLLPEHTNGKITIVCYGKVGRVDLERLGVTTKKLPNFPATTVFVNTRIHKPKVVTQTEFRGGQIGTWLRKSVVTLSTQDRFHGQVVEYDNRPPKLIVRTRAGDLDMRTDELSEIPGPLGLILFYTQLTASSTTMESLYDMHATIMKRIKGKFPEVHPVKTRAEIFEDLFMDPGSPTVPLEWTNPITGVNRPCRSDHAIECLRWEDNMDEKSLRIS